jgi:PIN domain nuclease of toxin-antitoxin system
MRLLVDTQMLVWIAIEPERISKKARKLLTSGEYERFFSVISIWEVAIKRSLQRDDFDVDPAVLRTSLLQLGWQEVLLESRHAIAVASLPHVHRDPFDRVLVAQAQVSGFVLLTADKTLTGYPATVIHAG